MSRSVAILLGNEKSRRSAQTILGRATLCTAYMCCLRSSRWLNWSSAVTNHKESPRTGETLGGLATRRNRERRQELGVVVAPHMHRRFTLHDQTHKRGHPRWLRCSNLRAWFPQQSPMSGPDELNFNDAIQNRRFDLRDNNFRL